MANRKAGSAGDESTGATKRSAGGRKSAAKTTGAGADQATDSGAAGAGRKRAGGTRGSAGSATSGSATADTQATGGGAAAKGTSKSGGASKGAAKGAAKGGAGAAKSAGGGATKSAAKGASKGAAKSTGGRSGGTADLRGDLRQFVTENPQGWGHEQWEGLLGRLRERGHDVSNPDDIGMQLERERLSSRLEGIDGVSAQKARSLVGRYGTVYSLWNADVDEIAREGKISREVAERIKSQLR